MSFSYFNPAVVRNNVIEGNEKGEVTIVENAGHELKIEKNESLKTPPSAIAVQGKIISAKYDPLKYVTHLSADKEPDKNTDWSGRVIRTGRQWALIKSIAGKEITVWGKVDPEETDFEIIAAFMEN